MVTKSCTDAVNRREELSVALGIKRNVWYQCYGREIYILEVAR
jgi:hypothetical protein